MSNIFLKLKQNWQSGLTVALVSLPLNIALSIASGAGPLPGVITGFWAGIIASFFAGSNYNVIGTAGALSTILANFILNQPNQPSAVLLLPFLAVMTGLIILFVYFLKLEKYLIYIPSSVMYGFAAGVAITIALNQIRDALGLYGLERHPEFLLNTLETIKNTDKLNLNSFLVFLVFLVLLLLIKKYIKQIPTIIPISILGIIFGHVESYKWNLGVSNLKDRQGSFDISLIQLPNFSNFFEFVDLPRNLLVLFNISLIIALIAILETLITAKLAEKITNEKFNSRKELLGLGLANIVSGFAGGLPATGVFVRTGLNIKSGANHKSSSGIAAALSGLLSLLFLPFFEYIPMPVIAAILFNTAIGLIEIHQFKRFWKEDTNSLIVSLLVALITLIADASIGIIIGVALSLLFFVDKLSKGTFEATFNSNRKIVKYIYGNCVSYPKKEECEIDVIVYSIEGIMAYLDAHQHEQNFQNMSKIPTLETLIIRMRDLFYLDLDGLDLLEEAIVNLKKQNKEVLITAPSYEVTKVLHNSKVFRELYKTKKVFAKTENALFSLGFKKEDLSCQSPLTKSKTDQISIEKLLPN
jgi:sulfate permease, SulP family